MVMKKRTYTKPIAAIVCTEPQPFMAGSGKGGDKGKYTVDVDGGTVAPSGGGGAVEGNPDEIDAKGNGNMSWDW